MTEPTAAQASEHEAHQIAKYTRTYAQNRRSFGVVALLAVLTFLSLALAGSSYLAGEAFRSHNPLLLIMCIAVIVPVVAVIIWCSVPRWGGRWMERLVSRYYAKEGDVAIKPGAIVRQRWVAVFAVLLFAGIIASVAAGEHIPLRYRQPISALYAVPFLATVALALRPAVGWLLLLWPALYALHAVLLLAGAPILFTGKWELLNMLIPVAGYGLLTNLASFAYGRFALSRLKELTRARLSDDDTKAIGQ